MTTQKPTHLTDTFYSEAYEKLFFPEFFIAEEPRNWNANAYLLQLVQKSPTITTRNGNKALTEDTKKMLAYVVPGTIADTVLRQMEGTLRSSKGKAAIKEFWKNSANIASTSVNYENLKYQLRGQMAEEVVDEGVSRSRKRQRVRATMQLLESNGEEGEEDEVETQGVPDNSGEEDDNNDVDDIWESWKRLLKSIRESTVLPALSPESHNVIWCGKKVLRRPVLPVELFQELNEQVPNIKIQCVDRIFKQLLLEAIDTGNKEEWLTKVKIFQNCSSTADLIAKRDLMTCIFNIFSKLFNGGSNTLSSSESCLRFYVIDPLLHACNEYLKDIGYDVTFYPGEIELKSMTLQLKDQGITDKRLRYNADGTILYNNIETEVLLSEVSSAFGENNRAKTSFDHYKAMFGLLMMLRTLARKYKYASFSTFKNLKVHFIHTHNQAIRHWSMSTPSPGLYLMNKEQKVDIIKDFERKSEGVIPFMNFTITLGVSLDETMKGLSVLSKEHEKVLRETYFETDDDTRVSLLDFVNPVLVRLNESKHKDEVAEEGPQSPSS